MKPADEKRAARVAVAVALIQARLRAEHLNAHLSRTALLSRERVRHYNDLRGYSDTQVPPPTPASATPQPVPRHH